MIDDQELHELVADCLSKFHERRLERVRKLTLKSVLRRKNPYLFKALGLTNPAEIVNRLVDDHVSSSDETIFGETFFKPVARSVAGGSESNATGVDFFLEKTGSRTAVKVVSGPNVLNSSQRRKQEDDFSSWGQGLEHGKIPGYDALLGHAYGKYQTEPKSGQSYRDRSGQDFWEELTGDGNFYQKLMIAMGEEAERQRALFEKAKSILIGFFVAELEDEFCDHDGNIDWEGITRFVSGST